MASQASEHSTETVALAFVEQYYRILHKLIDQSYRFYKDNSVLSWPQSDGKIKSVTTSEGINEFIISSHFKDNKVEVTTIDSQLSVSGGVLVVVTAFLIGQDNSRKSFSQTFFLAPQEKGYYVLNDIFRFVGVEESSIVVDEKALVAPLDTQRKVEDTVKEVSKVITDDQVDQQKPSITSNEKEKPVKISYASMMKQGRPSPSTNAPYKIVANTGLPSAHKKPQASDLFQASTPRSNAAAPSDNYNDEIQSKSIYIGGLPANTTRSDLYAVVKQFGPVHTRDVQLKSYEDGYCCGFVHFQDEVSAQNAVQVQHIIVKGREAYIRFKRINKGRGERAKSPSDRGGFRYGGSDF